MTLQSDNHPDAEQLQARQVGELASTRAQKGAASERAAQADPEIAQLVERVRWLMLREPMLEREM